MQFNSYKAGGILYKVTEEVYVGEKKWPKREIWIEVPTEASMSQGTEIYAFELFGDECSGTEWLEPGAWYDFVFRIAGKIFKPKARPTEEAVFPKLKIIDIKKGPNPFEKGKDIKNRPEDLSNTIVSELAAEVKDWANEPAQADIFKTKVGDDYDELPF